MSFVVSGEIKYEINCKMMEWEQETKIHFKENLPVPKIVSYDATFLFKICIFNLYTHRIPKFTKLKNIEHKNHLDIFNTRQIFDPSTNFEGQKNDKTIQHCFVLTSWWHQTEWNNKK